MIPVIAEADVINASTLQGLIKLLNEKLALGFQPYGEVHEKNGMYNLIIVKHHGTLSET